MRLSENRVRSLAFRMAKRMLDEGAVDPAIGTQNLSSLIAQVLINDLRVEDEIDEEARARVSKYPRLPPPGSGEYEAAFQNEKRAVAKRRGYPL